MTKKIVLAYAKPDDIELEMSVLENSGFEVIATNGGLVTGKPLTDPELWPLVQDASALLTGLHVVSDEMMAQMPNLELVTRVGTGYDAIDFDAAGKARCLGHQCARLLDRRGLGPCHRPLAGAGAASLRAPADRVRTAPGATWGIPRSSGCPT